jgi:uncharacterized protein YndB with AHSA1/START domain
MSNIIEIEITLPATPEQVYNAWLDSDAHAEMTGAEATVSDRVGGHFSAWEDYISGKNLELVPRQKIVQSWRTTDFNAEDPDSLVEIRLKPHPEGCTLTLIHSNIPEDQPDYEQGWHEYYFEPMVAYFGHTEA